MSEPGFSEQTTRFIIDTRARSCSDSQKARRRASISETGTSRPSSVVSGEERGAVVMMKEELIANGRESTRMVEVEPERAAPVTSESVGGRGRCCRRWRASWLR